MNSYKPCNITSILRRCLGEDEPAAAIIARARTRVGGRRPRIVQDDPVVVVVAVLINGTGVGGGVEGTRQWQTTCMQCARAHRTTTHAYISRRKMRG